MDAIALLQGNLDRHLEFVKFMEAKCLAFLAAAVALATVAIGGLANPEYKSAALFLLNVASFSLLAVVFLACAIFPLELRPRRFNDCVAEGQNIFFFGDTAGMKPRQIMSALPAAGETGSAAKAEAVALMLSEQVIINAIICLHKVRFLRAGAFCLVAAIATPFVAGAVLFTMLIARSRFRQDASA